jgi:phosphohistidine swiveling domain-containing protein
MVPFNKIPWKVDMEQICSEIQTPPDSVYGKDLQDFIRKTGHDVNLVVEDKKYFYDFCKKYVIVKIINGKRIPMVTPLGNLIWDERYMDKWLYGMTPEVIKRRLEWRQFKYDIAKKRGDRGVLALSDHFIKKYTPFTQGIEKSINVTVELFNKSRILKGESAYVGRARGKVYLIDNPDVVPSLKIGCVVVCKLTTAKLVPLIGKSAAVITDEGGILSHAAITCRESKVPCIIGTKIATQVLKNGDEVEVDANLGIVRKI